MKELYTDKGYLDFEKIDRLPATFILLIGARGIGKTYGAIKHVVQAGKKFALMRRTKTQADMIRRPELSPFKPLESEIGEVDIHAISKEISGAYVNDQLIGYTLALSTIANLRGFDGQDIEVLIYDEFIPEPHERPIKSEESAFLNAYETINRNRELTGRPALKCYCLSNSNTIDNAVCRALGLTEVLSGMVKRGQEIYLRRDTGICVIMPRRSPISAAKAETALYKAAGDRTFVGMALDNEFTQNDFGRIESRDLKQYKRMCSTPDFTIYCSRSGDHVYLSRSVRAEPYYDTGTIPGYENFRLTYSYLYWEYVAGNVIFESYTVKNSFLKLFDKKV